MTDTTEARRARTERAREASARVRRRAKQERLAGELTLAGWTCLPPETITNGLIIPPVPVLSSPN